MSTSNVRNAPLSATPHAGRSEGSSKDIACRKTFVTEIAKKILALPVSPDSPQTLSQSLAPIIKPFFPEKARPEQVERITTLVQYFLQNKDPNYGLFQLIDGNKPEHQEVVVNSWALAVLALHPKKTVSDVFTLMEHVTPCEKKSSSRRQDHGDTKSQVLSNPGIERVQRNFQILDYFWEKKILKEVFIPLVIKKWHTWQKHEIYEDKLKAINPFVLYLKKVSKIVSQIISKKIPHSYKKLAEYDFGDFDPQYLSALLGYLLSWETLDVSFSSLCAVPKLPDFYQSLPYFCHLRELNLGNNGLRSLPEELGSLFIVELSVKSNRIKSLPKSFRNLRTLQSFDMSNNCFKKFPEEILELKDLTTLAANENEIPSIPEKLWKLRLLKDLDLSDNKLKSLPEGLDKSNLRALRVSGNHIRALPRANIGLRTLIADRNEIESLPKTVVSEGSRLVLIRKNSTPLREDIQKIVLDKEKKLNRRNARSHERARSWASSAKSESKKKPSPRRQRGKSPGRSSSARSKSSSESRSRRFRRTQSTAASALRHQRSDSFRRSSAGRSNHSSLATPVPRSRRTQSAVTNSPRRTYHLQNPQTIKRAQSTTRVLRHKR